MPDLSKFYADVTPGLFRGSLPDWQREPLRLIVHEGLRRGRAIPEIAYALATAYHETDRFKTDEEYGQGHGHAYGRLILLIRGRRASYHGRGFCQLTWLRNYARMALLLTLHHGRSVDLVNDPDLARQPDHGAFILWEGMIRGMFTGHNLADYFGDGRADYRGARRIINGSDRAQLIAGHARHFEHALRLSLADPAPGQEVA